MTSNGANVSTNLTTTSITTTTDAVAMLAALSTVGILTALSTVATVHPLYWTPVVHRRREFNIILLGFVTFMGIAGLSQFAQGVRGSYAAIYHWPTQSQWECMKTVHITLNIAGWIGKTAFMVSISVDRLLCSWDLGFYNDYIDKTFMAAIHGFPTFLTLASVAAAWGLAAGFDPDRKISAQCTTGSTLTAPYFLFLNFLQLIGAVVLTVSFYAISYILMLRPHCNTSAIQVKQLQSEKEFTGLLRHVPWCTLIFFVVPQAIYLGFSFWGSTSPWLTAISNTAAILKGAHSNFLVLIFLFRSSELRERSVLNLRPLLRFFGFSKTEKNTTTTLNSAVSSYINLNVNGSKSP